MKQVRTFDDAIEAMLDDLLLLVKHTLREAQATDYGMPGNLPVLYRLIESYFCDEETLDQFLSWINFMTNFNSEYRELNAEEHRVRAIALRLQDASEFWRLASPEQRAKVRADMARARKTAIH